MKNFRKSISYILYWFGYTVQLNKINLKDFEYIKKTLLTFKYNDNVSSYSHLLNKISRQKIKLHRFVNKGAGANTTLTHTIVSVGSNTYFEKIYDRNSKMYACLKANYPYIYNQLVGHSIATPNLVQTIETGNIAICHFEYMPNLGVNKNENLDLYFKTINIFKRIPMSDTFLNRNYLEVRRFKEEFTRIILNIIEYQEFNQLLEIKHFVDKQEKIFTHGDFDAGNIFEHTIIDWDEAGFYPYGIDASKAIFHQYYYKDKEFSVSKLFQILDQYKLKNNEKINVAYFHLLLIQRYVSVEQTKNWISELYAYFKEEGVRS